MFCPNRDCPDFRATGIPGEYVDTVTVCPLCGAALVRELPGPGETGLPTDEAEDAAAPEAAAAPLLPPPEGALVSIAAFDYPDEAETLMASLAENGVSAYRFLDDGRDFADKGGIETCTRVLVPESQARLALRVLERFELERREG